VSRKKVPYKVILDSRNKELAYVRDEKDLNATMTRLEKNGKKPARIINKWK